ncbi:MAG: UvrB/UvrC motif-containing protein [Lachnospiraceae bacterium]|nr:UvrB/UvrC motif-containing protein [Lachnospiraceae bacterium]
MTAEEKIARLRVRLQEALAAEDYEQAVVCRDEIKALSGEK